MPWMVNKPFRADNREYKRGELVDPFAWRTGQSLINQRYIVQAPETVAPVVSPTPQGQQYARKQSR